MLIYAKKCGGGRIASPENAFCVDEFFENQLRNFVLVTESTKTKGSIRKGHNNLCGKFRAPKKTQKRRTTYDPCRKEEKAMALFFQSM